MKKVFITLLTSFLLINGTAFPSLSANAADTSSFSIVSVEMLENGYYYETIIEEDNSTSHNINTYSTSQTITRTKTTQLKNSAGEVMWSVSLKATFTYDGTTSKCISCTPSAKSYASTWSIKSITSSKSGNTGTATAVATHEVLGISNDVTKSVTLTCTAYGVVS